MSGGANAGVSGDQGPKRGKGAAKGADEDFDIVAHATEFFKDKDLDLGSDMRQFRLGRSITEKLASGELEMEWNGHWEDGKILRNPKEVFKHAHLSCDRISESDLADLEKAFESGKKLDRFVVFDDAGITCACTNCGEEFLLETDGETVRAVSECPSPDGVFPIEVEINVPSGKIVFANDLREWFEIRGEFDINKRIGEVQTTQKSAEIGMLHCFVGNTCPSIYQVDSEHVTISEYPEDERWDEEKKDYVPIPSDELEPVMPAGEHVGGVITDLWWWSGVDYDEFRRRFEGTDRQFEKLLKDLNATVVEVDPGVYKTSHRTMGHVDEHKGNSPYHFSIIDKVRDADPVEDFDAKINVDFTAGQILLDWVRRYPSLYVPDSEDDSPQSEGQGRRKRLDFRTLDDLRDADLDTFHQLWENLSPEDQMEALARAADHIICTSGNGHRWHKLGWSGASAEMTTESPEFKIPVFDRQFRWSDFSPGFASVCTAAGMYSTFMHSGKTIRRGGVSFKEGEPTPLNESFRELAFNVLQSIIRYGMVPTNDSEEAGKMAADTVKTAKVAFNRLVEMYPDDVPEYCKDLVKPKPKPRAKTKTKSKAKSKTKAKTKRPK